MQNISDYFGEIKKFHNLDSRKSESNVFASSIRLKNVISLFLHGSQIMQISPLENVEEVKENDVLHHQHQSIAAGIAVNSPRCQCTLVATDQYYLQSPYSKSLHIVLDKLLHNPEQLSYMKNTLSNWVPFEQNRDWVL